VLVGSYLPSITVSYLIRLESSRACIFNTVIGINLALVVYQYLYVNSNAAGDIVFVRFLVRCVMEYGWYAKKLYGMKN